VSRFAGARAGAAIRGLPVRFRHGTLRFSPHPALRTAHSAREQLLFALASSLKAFSFRSLTGGRVSERSAVMAGAVVGALVGVAATYLIFTERGRHVRERIEPTIDDLREEFSRFQRAFEKVSEMATEGYRVVQDFNNARSQSQGRFSSEPTSH
jgi:gas vesicle protein